jgi:hypothetical protein
MSMSVPSFPRRVLIDYRSHVKPGGYLELQCVHPRLRCDDGSAPVDSGLMEFSRAALDASDM